MSLTVIIPCYNAAETIERTLASLSTQIWDQPWDIIIADNGSTDNTLQVIERCNKKPRHLRIVDASARQGPAYARNTGASQSSAEAYIFCDADDEVAPGWLSSLGNALLKYDVVASRFESMDTNSGSDTKQQANGPQENGLQKLWYSPYCFHVGACGLGVKREVHEKLGGFDETLPALEDTDYCIRIQQNGFHLHFIPEALVYYRQRSTVRGIITQRRLWGMSNVMLYKKYRLTKPTVYEKVKMWESLLVRILYIVLHLPFLLGRQKRAILVRRFGSLIGVIQGVMKCRVPPI